MKYRKVLWNLAALQLKECEDGPDYGEAQGEDVAHLGCHASHLADPEEDEQLSFHQLLVVTA